MDLAGYSCAVVAVDVKLVMATKSPETGVDSVHELSHVSNRRRIQAVSKLIGGVISYCHTLGVPTSLAPNLSPKSGLFLDSLAL